MLLPDPPLCTAADPDSPDESILNERRISRPGRAAADDLPADAADGMRNACAALRHAGYAAVRRRRVCSVA